jgi:type III restriction enzyme
MADADVVAKREAAVAWCARASAYASSYSGKPWKYALIPHDAIADNMSLAGLAGRYGCS